MGQRRHQTELGLQESSAGRLFFGQPPLDDYGPRMQARLLGPNGEDLLSPLQYARILRIDGVMHIAGIEYYLRGRKGTPERWKQSWLCARRREDATHIISKINVPNITGFSDEDFPNDDLLG